MSSKNKNTQIDYYKSYTQLMVWLKTLDYSWLDIEDHGCNEADDENGPKPIRQGYCYW